MTAFAKGIDDFAVFGRRNKGLARPVDGDAPLGDDTNLRGDRAVEILEVRAVVAQFLGLEGAVIGPQRSRAFAELLIETAQIAFRIFELAHALRKLLCAIVFDPLAMAQDRLERKMKFLHHATESSDAIACSYEVVS